jgi:hypothetical protein
MDGPTAEDLQKNRVAIATPILRLYCWEASLHQADLRQNALTSQVLSRNSDNEAQHCQATVPSLSEANKTKLVLVFHDEYLLTG